MRQPNSKLLVATFLCLTLIIGASLTNNNSPLIGLLHHVHFGPSNNLQIDLATSAVPNTNPKAQPDFDIFAWNSFIALNWPAIAPTKENGFIRGIPNTNKTH